ncbi:Putative ribonuclease H protein At1g65750 [Linum perenne]
MRWERMCPRKEFGGLGFRDPISSNLAMLRSGMRWKLGNGQQVNIWDDPWLRGEDGSWIVSPMVEGLEHLVVNDLIVPGMPEWDEGLLGDLFSARDIESILFMTPPASNEKDRIIWGLSRDGRYTVRSAYRLATDSLRPTPLETVEGDWNRIWRLEMAPKIKHLIWRLARHVLPTKASLTHMGISLSTNCGLCADGEENA